LRYKAIVELIVPEPYNQSYENNHDDQVRRILQYLYSNQVSSSKT